MLFKTSYATTGPSCASVAALWLQNELKMVLLKTPISHAFLFFPILFILSTNSR